MSDKENKTGIVIALTAVRVYLVYIAIVFTIGWVIMIASNALKLFSNEVGVKGKIKSIDKYVSNDILVCNTSGDDKCKLNIEYTYENKVYISSYQLQGVYYKDQEIEIIIDSNKPTTIIGSGKPKDKLYRVINIIVGFVLIGVTWKIYHHVQKQFILNNK